MAERTDIAVIGAGAAGSAAAEAAVTANPGLHVTLISSEPGLPYKRTKVSKSLAEGFDEMAFDLHPPEWYRSTGIRVLDRTLVTDVDRTSRILRAGGPRGELSLQWRALVIATGSRPAEVSADDPLSAVPADRLHFGHSRPAVQGLRSAVVGLRAELGRPPRVAVLGGGVLGLELAWDLYRMGAEVTVIHRADRLMDRNLDAEASAHLLRATAAHGVRVFCSRHLLRTRTPGSGIHLELGPAGAHRQAGAEQQADAEQGHGGQRGGGAGSGGGAESEGSGASLEADLVVRASGHTPEIHVGRQAGLSTATGILVDECLRSSAPGIFAAGDCAEHPGGRITHLWRHAIEQGALAGANAAASVANPGAQPAPYQFVPFRLKCEVFGAYYFSLLPEGSGDTRNLVLREGERYYHCYLRDDRLSGMVMMNDKVRADSWMEAVREGWTEERLRAELAKAEAFDLR